MGENSMQKYVDWYYKDGGDALIHKLVPECSTYIEYNGTIRNEGNTGLMGIYGIYLNDKLVYVGESKNIAHRFLQHMYNMIKEETEWGIKLQHLLDGVVKVRLEIIETNLVSEEERTERELHYIKKLLPLLQRPSIKYYPDDKVMYDRRGIKVPREHIPEDRCVLPHIRKEVIKEELKL